MTGTVYQKWRRFARNGGVLGAGLRLSRSACILGARPARRGGLLRFAARAYFARFVLHAPPALLFVFSDIYGLRRAAAVGRRALCFSCGFGPAFEGAAVYAEPSGGSAR